MRQDLYDLIKEKVSDVQERLRAALADSKLTVGEVTGLVMSTVSDLAELAQGLPANLADRKALVAYLARRLYDEEIAEKDIAMIPGRGKNPDGLPEGWEGAVDEFLRGTIGPAVALFFKMLPKDE